jgi:hypothetical protein
MKFKETKVGKWLGEKAPAILDQIDDYFPPAKILTALVTKELPPEQRFEFEKLMAEYEAKERADYLADVANARDMNKAAIMQNDIFTKRFNAYLTTGSIILGFTYIFCITFFPVPLAAQRFADTILGVVISLVFGSIYNFHYGSSQGSHNKNELLKNLKNP